METKGNVNTYIVWLINCNRIVLKNSKDSNGLWWPCTGKKTWVDGDGDCQDGQGGKEDFPIGQQTFHLSLQKHFK